MGDFNINSLHYDQFPCIRNFVDMIHSYSAVNLINKPTRFPVGAQLGSPTLLDHFYTNKPNKVRHIGLLVNDISDHFPIVAIISEKMKVTNKDVYPYVRDFRNFNISDFQSSLSEFTDNEQNDLDTRFENFHNHILDCINRHIPLRKRTNKEKKFALKPWIPINLPFSEETFSTATVELTLSC